MTTPAPTQPRGNPALDAEWDALDPAPGEPPALSRRPTPPGANAVTLAPDRSGPARTAAKVTAAPRPDAPTAPPRREAPTTPPRGEQGELAEPTTTPSELRYLDALAAKRGLESSLGSLQRAIEHALGDARSASRTLGDEFERLHEVLVVARRERDSALTALSKEQADHARVLEEQDLFVATLIEDYEGKLTKARSGDFQPVPAEREALGGEEADRPTMPFTLAAKDIPGSQPTDRPQGESARVKELQEELDRMERERDKSREMLRKLMKQRDEAQAALGQALQERDESRTRVFDLKARILEIQEKIEGPGAVHKAMTEPAPPEPDADDGRRAAADPLGRTLPRTATSPFTQTGGVVTSVTGGFATSSAGAPTERMRPVRDLKRTLPSAPTPAPMPAVSSPLSKTLPAGTHPRRSPPPMELMAAAVLPPADTEASPGVYSVNGRELEPEQLEGARISSRPPPSSRSR